MKTFKHPYWFAIIIAVLCTFLTAVGAAISQIIVVEEHISYLIMAGSVVISAIVGLIIMRKSGISMQQFGFQRPAPNSMRHVWWVLPLFVLEIIPIIVYGFPSGKPAIVYAALALFTIIVGFNEELYFRGLVFNVLKTKGTKVAIIGSSIIFGVLHAATALGGKNIWLVLLQVGFAFLAGLILVQIVNITKTLWIGIVWHIVHNFISFSTEDVYDNKALIVISAQVIIFIIYAIKLRKLSLTSVNIEDAKPSLHN
jgi:membrane protease YdiL (CAAX protease family)